MVGKIGEKMYKKEYENLIDKKLASVKEELMQEFDKNEDKIKYPEVGTVYYYLNNTGDIYKSTWGNHPIDKDRFNIGNYFETREEAEHQVERLKVITELKHFAEPKDRKWDDNNKHWYFYIHFMDDCLYYSYAFNAKHGEIYFSSKEDAIKAVETVGEDRVKKYYLEVE